MMLKKCFLTLSIFIFATVTVISEEDGCTKNPFEKCRYPKLFTMIPDSEADFNAICPELTNYVLCLKVYEDLCGEGNNIIFEPEEVYENLYNIFSALCDKGTLINAVVTENLRCLNRTFSSTRCGEDTYSILNTYRKPTKSSPDEEILYSSAELHCLLDILNVGCVIEEIAKNCGTFAKHASLEFIRGSYFIEYSCSAENAKLLLRNVHRYNLEEYQREYLRDVLKSLVEKEDMLPSIPVFK
ncbi:unnamed protein product [Larinioides sclopetarius]|uniref:Secreted protein n=1 Tax=Larinioides sclopetarius TaxID=280406 RepID=A0AAV2BM65_9ARAC